ncbi:MAG: CRISPR-associated protein Csm7, partial [Bacteroidetes bacterium]
MQATYVVYMKPRSGFRGSLRSDTLWGTLCWAMRLLYGETAL